MKNLFFALSLASLSAVAAEECFQVSAHKNAWANTPELLCVEGDTQRNDFKLTLKTGLPFDQKTVATFNLNLLEASRCVDCNKNVYGLANPSNSSFNTLAIRFDGLRGQDMKEEGTVSIGETKLYYRSL